LASKRRDVCWSRDAALAVAHYEENSMRVKVEGGGPCVDIWRDSHRDIKRAVAALEAGRDSEAWKHVVKVGKRWKKANRCEKKNGWHWKKGK
jgi:hypothetical protein